MQGRFAVPLVRDPADGVLEDDVPDAEVVAQYEETRSKKRWRGEGGHDREQLQVYKSIDTKWWSHFINGGTNWSPEKKLAARQWVKDGAVIGDGYLRQFFRFLYLSNVSKHVFKVRARSTHAPPRCPAQLSPCASPSRAATPPPPHPPLPPPPHPSPLAHPSRC